MKKIFILLFTSIIVLSFTACTESTKQSSNKQTLTLYKKMIKEKKLSVGYIAYPPNFIKNPDGSYAGVFYDTMQEIGKKLGVEIEYKEEVTWDGMIEAIKTGRVDMVVTGIWPTAERGKHVDFANPLFFSVVKAYTYYENKKFDLNIQAINSSDVKISTIDGEMTSIIANMDFPKAKNIAVSQMGGVSQTLLDIKAKKADITFLEPAIALEFDAKNPNTIRAVEGIEPLRIFPNAMMLPKGEEAFKSTLNTAINELIYNGFVDRLLNKYEKYPNSFYRVQPPYRK